MKILKYNLIYKSRFYFSYKYFAVSRLERSMKQLKVSCWNLSETSADHWKLSSKKRSWKHGFIFKRPSLISTVFLSTINERMTFYLICLLIRIDFTFIINTLLISFRKYNETVKVELLNLTRHLIGSSKIIKYITILKVWIIFNRHRFSFQ